MDAIPFSDAPVVFSHNAAHTLRPVPRCRNDEELLACAQKGGLIAITAVPNSLSDDPAQDINCVLDHYDYMVKLVGIDHVGDRHRYRCGQSRRVSPGRPWSESRNSCGALPQWPGITRGWQEHRPGSDPRGYSDRDIQKIAGGNALAFFRRGCG